MTIRFTISDTEVSSAELIGLSQLRYGMLDTQVPRAQQTRSHTESLWKIPNTTWHLVLIHPQYIPLVSNPPTIRTHKRQPQAANLESHLHVPNKNWYLKPHLTFHSRFTHTTGMVHFGSFPAVTLDASSDVSAWLLAVLRCRGPERVLLLYCWLRCASGYRGKCLDYEKVLTEDSVASSRVEGFRS